MIYNNTRTIYGLKLQTCKLLNIPYHVLNNTTLNEKFNILPNYEFSEAIAPNLNMFVIGVGGSNTIDNSALSLKKGVHKPIDGALYKHVPFIVRELTLSLTPEERAIYRLRTVELLNGVPHECYYGRVIEDIEYVDDIYKISNSAFSLNSGIYNTSLDTSILYPIANINKNLSNTDSDYIINTCKISMTFTTGMVEELKIAISKKYPNEVLTAITEIGVCSSIDVVENNVKEAVWAQVNYFIDTTIDMVTINNKIHTDEDVEISLDIGGMECLMV